MHIDTITRASPTISTSSIVGEWVIACVVIVTDIILWQGHHDRVIQLNLLYLCGICQMMPLKVWPNNTIGSNHQSICMPRLQALCSAALANNVPPQRDEGSSKHCALIEAS